MRMRGRVVRGKRLLLRQTGQLFGASPCTVLVKYTPEGVALWAKRTFGRVYGVTAFPEGGFVTTGEGWVDSDPAFLARHKPDGSQVWCQEARHHAMPRDSISALVFGTASGGRAVTLDSTGNILVAGLFRGNVTFGPGQDKAITLVGGVHWNILVSNYSPAGQLAWVVHGRGKEDKGNLFAHGIALGKDGDAFVIANSESTFQYDTAMKWGAKDTTEIPGLRSRCFIAKLRGGAPQPAGD